MEIIFSTSYKMGEIEDNCKKIRAVFPPNAPMEPRNHFSTTPVIYDTLFFVDFNKLGKFFRFMVEYFKLLFLFFFLGNCILGTSGVAETFWEGTLLYFDNIKQLDNFDYQTYYIYSSNSDGKFINDKTVIIVQFTCRHFIFHSVFFFLLKCR